MNTETINEVCITDECENMTHLVVCDDCVDSQFGSWESSREEQSQAFYTHPISNAFITWD